MTKENANPQSPEEMAKAAQEAAVKAAMEQAQAMFGNIPGFQMPEGMQEQLMAQMGAGVPDMAAAQAQHEAMLKAAGIDPETVAQASRQNMAYAQQMMQEMMDGTLGKELSSSDAMAQMMTPSAVTGGPSAKPVTGNWMRHSSGSWLSVRPCWCTMTRMWIRLTALPKMWKASEARLRAGGM